MNRKESDSVLVSQWRPSSLLPGRSREPARPSAFSRSDHDFPSVFPADLTLSLLNAFYLYHYCSNHSKNPLCVCQTRPITVSSWGFPCTKWRVLSFKISLFLYQGQPRIWLCTPVIQLPKLIGPKGQCPTTAGWSWVLGRSSVKVTHYREFYRSERLRK